MADKAHELTDQKIAKMQRHIASIYTNAQKDVTAEMQDYARSIKSRADKLLADIDNAETEQQKQAAESAYKNFYAVTVKQDRAFQKTSQNAAERLYQANTEAADYINEQTAGIYVLNYNAIGNGLAKDLDGYDFKPVSEYEAETYGDITQQTIDKAKDKKWNTKNIMTAVIAGAMVLNTAEKIFKNTAKSVTRKNRESSDRQASDSMTDAETLGRLDSMYRASDEGFDVKKDWIATLDNRTRDTHRMYDGFDPVPLDYEYNVGLKKPRDPNCPIMAEVCNCRCTLVSVVNNRHLSNTRAARDNDVTDSYKKPSSFVGTHTVTVPNMTYREWQIWRRSQ